MSIFGRGAAPAQDQAQMANAVQELEMVSDLFKRLVRSCHTKCIGNRYAEPDLNKGESVCVDRCVDKYFKVNEKVGERMQAAQGNAAQSGGPAPLSM